MVARLNTAEGAAVTASPPNPSLATAWRGTPIALLGGRPSRVERHASAQRCRRIPDPHPRGEYRRLGDRLSWRHDGSAGTAFGPAAPGQGLRVAGSARPTAGAASPV